jgi:predicted nucleic acid-binding protein
VRYVLDADVLIGALDANDAHHKQSKRLLTGWHAHQDTLLVSLPNLSEVLVAPAADEARLRAARAAIAALGVGAHQPNEAIAVDAARIRGQHPVSLPDAYLLATARHLDAHVASYDAKLLKAAKVERIASYRG